MTYILNLETSTKNCSVSLAQNGVVIASREIAEQGFSHAEKLHVFIEEVIAEANIAVKDLAAIAVGKGPGSYTGLRIGVSSAKGLSYALDIPLIALDTLEVLARQLQITEGYIVPMLDARRMEVYNAVFDTSYQKTRSVQAEVIDEFSFSEYTENLYFLGDGASKCKSTLNKSNHIFIEDILYPSALQMAMLSFEAYKKSDTVDVAYFEPFYLKDFLIQPSKK